MSSNMRCPKCWGSKKEKGTTKPCTHCNGIGTKPDEWITNNFDLSEFLISQTAIRKSIPNVPTDEVRINLLKVAQGLEKIRTKFGGIIINSGYRSPELNLAIGGSSKTSAHMLGLAADFIPATRGITLKEIVDWAVANKADINYDQIIYEGTWIHIGFAAKPRGQALMMFPDKNGKVRYFQYDPKDPRVV